MTMNELSTQQPQQMTAFRNELTIADIKHRHLLIQQAMREVMVEGQHYGVIPGTDKPALLKSGAEKLCSLFMFAPSFSVVQRDLPNNHREFRVTCTLTHIPSGVQVAMADGSCSTMESKYRWRLSSRKCPECQSEAIRKSKQGGGFFCWSKLGGCGAEFPEGDRRIIDQNLGRVENQDIADQHNTCLKMASKRSLVAATQIATAASDMFVQEDDEEEEPERKVPPKKAEAKKPVELTAKQKLLQACVGMFEQLTKAGRSKEGLIELLGTHGVVMPAKWGELAETQLEIVRKAFEEELKLGTEVK